MRDLLGRRVLKGKEALEKHIQRMARASMMPAMLEEDIGMVRGRYLFEINKRLVLSMSCFAFAMIAIPLSIRVHRREKTVNVLIGVMIALLYYTVILVVEKSGQTAIMHPYLIIWLPPIMTVLLGLKLFKRLKIGM